MIGAREKRFMQHAIALSRKGMESGDGGPFGAVVVKGDEIIGEGWNQVLATTDPTAHAEVVAIRQACERLGAFQLTGCEIYTSCEPCPMCLGAIYWARPQRVYYANTKEDAAAIDFDDSFIYKELEVPHTKKKIPLIPMPDQEALAVFREWKEKGDKTLY
ncbi:tRNA(Arg) A34 adenosine deaminase TadA [Chitinophaga terrae (ex Kim and Jung 2007)]|uniref:tRNA(Arg) A34 adenosine deaminase TadA n=1 Tax=Chitinophaga terrae (ex Kim and Jung 2007) TaxID=408074 RepID=A0A1H3YY72_9BACT|nr:nucleoside deaminase [Chitinophaga terrae (ex Kim and Jung 2007)]MDQ0107294.1 tRNA(Arg) A34 adenosine deaminase TadA [Chitinophaga terrae (ex Kim and Jung 2007)]SEA16370.1 tRNA(Arg) A34 adenosine deaminase TadA [Chitinophaga terrae (ex Kim and Jung 2007)]